MKNRFLPQQLHRHETDWICIWNSVRLWFASKPGKIIRPTPLSLGKCIVLMMWNKERSCMCTNSCAAFLHKIHPMHAWVKLTVKLRFCKLWSHSLWFYSHKRGKPVWSLLHKHLFLSEVNLFYSPLVSLNSALCTILSHHDSSGSFEFLPFPTFFPFAFTKQITRLHKCRSKMGFVDSFFPEKNWFCWIKKFKSKPFPIFIQFDIILAV